MSKIYNEFFSYQDNFKIAESIVSDPIFEAKLNSNPKFTIAIPTYKRTHLLKDAIESALNQIDFNNYDIIIVDNNPESDSEVETLMNQYNNSIVSYYKNRENIGGCNNWNRLYTLAKGEWVVMLHDDDLLLPNYLEVIDKLVSKLPEFKVFYQSFQKLKLGGSVNFGADHPKKIIIGIVNENGFLFNNIIGAPIGMCINKKSFFEIGGFSEKYLPPIDYEFYTKVSHYFKSCKIINYPLTVYRIEDNDSMKKEVLIGCMQQDLKIKKIIAEKLNIFTKYLWYLAFNQSGYTWVEEMNATINIEEELELLGYKKTLLTKIAYKICKKLYRRFDYLEIEL